MRPALVAYALSQPWQKKVHQKALAEEGKAILFCSISFSPQRLKRVYIMYIIRRPLTRTTTSSQASTRKTFYKMEFQHSLSSWFPSFWM